MPDEARFIVFMAAAFLFFVALLQFTIRKRTMKPHHQNHYRDGFRLVVFRHALRSVFPPAFPHLPWEIYYGLPALTTVLLPPLWLRMSRRHAIIDRRYAMHSILAGFVPLRDGVLAHRQRLPSSLPLTTCSKMALSTRTSAQTTSPNAPKASTSCNS